MSASGDAQFRHRQRDFSRNGPLSPELLLTLLLYMIADGNRRGYGLLLDGFWDEARSFSLTLPTDKPITAASFCSARRKITTDLLVDLLGLVRDEYHQSFGSSSRWHGRRVFAVDGVKINLQRHPDLEDAFGVPDGGHCPQVLASMVYDVCAKLPIDMQISSSASCERRHLLQMLPNFRAGDLLVLDRGYPSHEVIQALRHAGIDFLVRVPASSTFKAIDAFRERGRSDGRIQIDPPDGSPDRWTPLKARAVRLLNHDGEESFFVTTLSKNEFTASDIRELYQMRWEQEEFYKLAQSDYIGQGQLRSKSPAGVRQEIHALALFLSISRYLMALAAASAERDVEEVSQKAAVLATASYVTRLFLHGSNSDPVSELRSLLKRIAQQRYRKRRGRSYPRRSFKPGPRWGSKGRRGG